MLRQTGPTFPKNLTDFIVDSRRAQTSRKKMRAMGLKRPHWTARHRAALWQNGMLHLPRLS
jgi:hypothetical protein